MRRSASRSSASGCAAAADGSADDSGCDEHRMLELHNSIETAPAAAHLVAARGGVGVRLKAHAHAQDCEVSARRPRVLDERDRVEEAVAVKIARDDAEEAGERPAAGHVEAPRLGVAHPAPYLQLALGTLAAAAVGAVGVVSVGRREEDVDKVVGVVVCEGEEGAACLVEAELLRDVVQVRRPRRAAAARRGQLGWQDDVGRGRGRGGRRREREGRRGGRRAR